MRPILEYASPVWDPYQKESINALEKVQRRAARWIVNNYNFNVDSNAIARSLNLPTLLERRQQARLIALYKHKNGQIVINSAVQPQLSTRRHSSRTAHSQCHFLAHYTGR